MFKVGDVVICLKGISEELGGPRKDEIFTITVVDYPWIGFKLKNRRYYYNDSNSSKEISEGLKTNWSYNCFRFALPEEINYYNFPNKLEALINEEV